MIEVYGIDPIVKAKVCSYVYEHITILEICIILVAFKHIIISYDKYVHLFTILMSTYNCNAIFL